ncbi:MAG: cardiolipin synthase ClsB [Thiobacillaceae bacterium]
MVSGNHVRLLQSGADFFPALIAAIDTAQLEVRLETYIFNLDASGSSVGDALIRAAQRGVQVALLIDGVGSRTLPPTWLGTIRQAGVRVLVYRPPHPGWLGNPLNLRRLHRKLAVIDARIAFIGGMNIIDDFVPVASAAPRLDYSVEISGPLLVDIHRNAKQLWRLVARSQLQPALDDFAVLEPSWPTDGHARAAYIVRDNFRYRRNIERAYLTAIDAARHDLIIASAYFLPGRRFRVALKNAAARGVRVSLLVQGCTDHPFFHAASRALYSDLLSAGVKIIEYHASELHAKVAVVDSHWVTVGSSNIDPFSLLLAREANIVSEDRELAQQLQAKLQHAIENGAVELLPADWQRRTWPRRLLSWIAYGSVRWMVGIAGFGRWV